MKYIQRIYDLFGAKTVKTFPPLTESLFNKEILFRSPPFTEEFIESIRLIAPHLVLHTDEPSRSFWEHNQNSACWGEDAVISKYLSKRNKPKKILEIGPGMGRSVVFLTKKYNLRQTEFHLYESTGEDTKYTINGPRFTDSFCGTLQQLRAVLEYNGIHNYRIFDAKDLKYKINHLPGRYDMVYSFYAIGFHWNLEFFFDEILQVMKKNALGFFIVHDQFVPFDRLKKINYRIVPYTAGYPANTKKHMLIISRSSLV